MSLEPLDDFVFYMLICSILYLFPQKSTNYSNIEDVGHESLSPVVFVPLFLVAEFLNRVSVFR